MLNQISSAMQVRSVVGCFQDKRYSTSQAEIDPCPYPPHSTLEYTSLELTGALRSFNNEIDVQQNDGGVNATDWWQCSLLGECGC